MRTVNPVQHSAQERKILDAADRLFTEKGYRGTSMMEIAASCNLTKASLYHYFEGKKSILLALSAHRINKMDICAKAAWSSHSLREALEAIAKMYFDLTQQTNAYEMLVVHSFDDEKSDETFNPLWQAIEHYEADFLEGAVGHGLVPPGDEEKLRLVLYSFFGSLFRFNMDKKLFRNKAMRLSQEKYGRYIAALTAAHWKTETSPEPFPQKPNVDLAKQAGSFSSLQTAAKP